jgi:hypothetical protein
MTLNNAYQAGLLDRTEKGIYAINSVGENLVTMTLPGRGAKVGKKTANHKSKAPVKKATKPKVTK